MSTGFRKPALTPEEFVNGAKTAVVQEAPPPAPPPPAPPKAAPTPTPRPPAVERPQRVPLPAPDMLTEQLNPRVMKQVNFDMAEPDHYELKQLVDSIPKMSLRKFILEAVKEKMERLRIAQR